MGIKYSDYLEIDKIRQLEQQIYDHCPQFNYNTNYNFTHQFIELTFSNVRFRNLEGLLRDIYSEWDKV